MKSQIIPQKIFNKIQSLVPILNIDAIIYNSDGDVYLHFRDVIPHKNKWTLPGGRLRMHEDVYKCLLRHVSETGLKVLEHKFIGYYDWKKCDSRQHSVSLVFLVKSEGTPGMGKFFKSLPNNMPLSVRRCVTTFYNI